MRMGIAFGCRAVRRPARMRDTNVALQRVARQQACQVLKLASGASTFEAGWSDYRDTCRVVTAVGK